MSIQKKDITEQQQAQQAMQQAAQAQQQPAVQPAAPMANYAPKPQQVAVTPQMQMPTNRPVIPTPQPTARQGASADTPMKDYAPKPQVIAPQTQPQMPTGQPYTDYMRKPDIQPATPVSVVPQTVPQQQIQSQKLDQLKGAPDSLVPQIPEPSQEPLQTKALEQASPAYWQKYGNYNWNSNGGDFFKNVAEADIPLADAIRYYDAFQKDNGGQPLDPYSLYALMGKYDPTQSVKKQNEEDERLKRQQQWEKIGNVLSHMANLYGTMKGAPAMPLEDAPALTKRQQEQVDRVRTLRQAAGKQYLDALQAKKAEEFKQKQMEHQDRMYDLQDKKLELEGKYKNAKTEAEKEKLQAQMAELQAKLALLAARTEKTQTETKAIPKKLENDTTRAEATKQKAKRGNRSGSGGGGKNDKDWVKIRVVSGKDSRGNYTYTEKWVTRKEFEAQQQADAEDVAALAKATEGQTAEQKEAAAKAVEAAKHTPKPSSPPKGKGKGKNGAIVIKGIVK